MKVEIFRFLPGFLITIFAASRLAKFNIDTRQTNTFLGVPVPAVGLLIAALPLVIRTDTFGVAPHLVNPWVLYAITGGCCFLMVSSIPMLSFKFKPGGLVANKAMLAFISLAIVAVAVGFAMGLKFLIIPILFVLYIIVSVFTTSNNNDLQSSN